MDVGKLQISVDLTADDLASEITKAVEKQLEPVLAKIRAQINETARDLNKIDGRAFIDVAVDAKAAQKAVDEQGRASAKAAVENEANAKALEKLARAEAEFAAAQKSGDLAQRSMAMSKLTQAMNDYERVTGRSAGASRDFADAEVKNLDKAVQATEKRANVSARTARAQVANNKAIQDAMSKTAAVAEDVAARRAKAEQKTRDEIAKTEKVLDEAARRAAERRAAGVGGGGRGGGGGGAGGGGSGGGGDERGAYHGFVTRAVLNPVGANLIGLGLAGIPAATLVVTDLGAALEQLSKTGLAVPGIMAGIVASVGTAAVGLSGMKKAVTDLTKAINDDDPKALKAANDEMKDMAPAAKQTAEAIAGLVTGPLKDLRKSVEGKMFDGMAGEINHLSGVLIPRLTTDMNGTATAWNKTFKTILSTAGTSSNLGLMDRIFGNTASAQTRANAAIAPLVDGMGKLSAEGSAFLPRLASGVDKVAHRFDAFINKSVQNGNLDKWISDGLTGMTHLGNSALNFGKTLDGIFKADGNRNFLEWLDKATQRWAQFTNSTKGQSQIKAFLKEAADDLHRWEPVLGNLLKLLGQIIGGAQAWSQVMLPFLQSASSLLLHMPHLVQGITVAFLAWRTMSGVSSVLGMITKLGGALDAVPAKAAAAGAAIAEIDAEGAISDTGGTGGGGVAGGGGRGRRGRLGKFGRGAASVGLFMGADQLMQGVDPGNASNGGVGGWLQAIGGGAVTGASIGAFGGPELAAAGAALGGTIAAAIKGLESVFSDKSDKPKPLVPGALMGQEYQDALNQQVMPNGPGGAPWNQELVDQAFYGTSGSFDPRRSPYSTMTAGDANYNTVLAEMQKGGQGAFSSIPGLTSDNAQQVLDRVVKQAHDAGGALDKLGGDITDLPTGEVVIKDPTPEILKRVEDLGGKLHSLPSGLIAVDTTQLNTASEKANELAETLVKIHQGDPSAPGAIPAAPPGSGGGLPSLFPGIPGRAGGGIIRHFDEGGAGDPGGGSPWRVAAQIGSQFVDEATMVAIKMGQAAMKGGSGALSTVGDIAGKVIGPLGIAAPFVMDAIDPQARTTTSDVTALNRGKALPDSSFAGMLPGYTPGQDTMALPLFGGGQYALSGGEGVVIPEAMKALGPDWLYGINSSFRPGLPKGNYSTGGILGRFAPGGVGGGGGIDGQDSTNDILKSMRDLLGGSKYGPLTALQYSGVMQQQYLQRIATGGALNGTLAPGTTPGRVGPWGTPVKPINIGEAMARGAIQGLGGNPDIIFGPDSVDYAIQQSNSIESALRQAAGQPGGIAALGRPTNPADYVDTLTRFAQTGQITPEMTNMGLTPNSPIITQLNTARMSKGPERQQIPQLIQQSLAGGGFTGQLTPENQSILQALSTFREDLTKQDLQRQQLNMTLAPYGGIAGLPDLIAKNPQLGALMPTGGAMPGMPGVGPGSGGSSGMTQDAAGRWHANDPWWEGVIQAESGGNIAPTANPTHFGLFQFSQQTWDGIAKDIAPGWVGKNPGTAPADVQAQMAQENYNRNKGNLAGQWVNPYVAAHPGGTTGSIWSPGGATNGLAPISVPAMPPLAPSPGDVPPGTPTLWPGGPPVQPVGPPAGAAPPPPAPPPAPPALPPSLLNPPGGGLPSGLPGAMTPENMKRYLLDQSHATPPTPGVPGAAINQSGQNLQNLLLPGLSPAPGAPAAPALPGNPNDPTDNRPGGGGWLQEHPTGAVDAMPTPPPVVAPPAAPGMPPPPPVPGMPGAPAGFAGSGGSGLNLATIPVAAQKYANDCIDASARIILSHSGANLDEDALQRVIAPGGTISSQAAGMNQLNPAGKYVPMEGSGGSQEAMFSAIKSSIDTGAGATLNIAPGSSLGGKNFGEGHFVAVTGYNPDGTINISDTAGGTQYSVSAADAFQASRGRGIVAGTGTGPAPVPGMPSPLAAGAPGLPGVTPGAGGQFGAGGVFGGGGGVVPVMVTNWPGSMGGGGGGLFGGGPAGQQLGQIAAGVAAPVLGAAGNAIGNVAGDAINATPAALQSVFESPAGINAPPVNAMTAFNQHDPIQGVLASLGINVPDMSRSGAVQLAGAHFQQGGGGFDSEGRLLSDTTDLYRRTSTDLNAHLMAMKDQLVGATTSVGDKLTKNALTPLLKAGVSAGMGAIPSAVLASMGTSLGTAMAPPIANAVSQSGGGGGGTASDISALPFNATAATFQGLNTLVMAGGGSVTGGTPGQDSVPILGMPGEWMMTVDEVAKMGGEAGMAKFTDALKKSGGVRYMAAGGSVLAGSSGGGTNPGTAGTNTTTLGADFFGVSQVPILGPILDVLLNILLSMMGIQVTVRDTMLNLGDNFKQFRGDSFKAFTAQGQLLNDTSGLIDRSKSSSELVTDERIRILTQVLEGVIQYILDKVVIPLSEAVAQAAINAAASAGGGALNAVAPGAGSAAGAAASALGDAAVQIGGQVGQDFGDAALGSIFQALSTGLIQNGAGQWGQSIFAPAGQTSFGTGLDTGAVSGALGGGIAALLLPLLGLGGLAVTDSTGALFDNGGLAYGEGNLPKATVRPERVLSPQQTESFERLVNVLEGGRWTGQSTTTVHAPITVMGNNEAGQNVRDSLLSLMT